MQPSLTQTQIDLIQKSFQKVISEFNDFADEFYTRLFEREPAYRPLFKRNIDTQGTMLVQMLVSIVNSLNSSDSVAESMQKLGRNHAGYQVKPEDYAVVGQILIETLTAKLGSAFSNQEREAWETAYTMLSSIAIEAATEPQTE